MEPIGQSRIWLSGLTLLVAGAMIGVGATKVFAPRPHRGAPAASAPAPAAAHPSEPPSSAQVAQAQRLGHTFAQVASQLGPSVVRITVTSKAEMPDDTLKSRRFGNPFEGTPFEHFFDDVRPRGPQRHLGMGSGVVIDARGYILTNDHVVEDAEDVEIAFADGKTAKAKVVGSDSKSDLAVVQVAGVPVTPAALGDSDKAQVGDWVIAIGNPFGLDHTVTVGVLSAKNRSGLNGGQYEDFLQTDASINPGNSGGPLVDLDGKVIGINTMIAGIGTDIGFAVPISMAKPIAQQLIATGKVRRPWLGIGMQEMTPELHKSLGGGTPAKGALVSGVQPGSPAEKAGIKPGDVITAVAGKPVDAPRVVQRDVLAKKIGENVAFTLSRDGKSLNVEIKAGELPPDKKAQTRSAPASPRSGVALGIELHTLTPDLAGQLKLPEKLHGALIVAVAPGGRGALSGLQPGDVILEVDRKPVASAEDAAKALGARGASGHLLRVQRGESALFVVVAKQ